MVNIFLTMRRLSSLGGHQPPSHSLQLEVQDVGPPTSGCLLRTGVWRGLLEGGAGKQCQHSAGGLTCAYVAIDVMTSLLHYTTSKFSP